MELTTHCQLKVKTAIRRNSVQSIGTRTNAIQNILTSVLDTRPWRSPYNCSHKIVPNNFKVGIFIDYVKFIINKNY